MKERITYVAYDDTEFDTEEECVQYEEEAHRVMDFLYENVLCYTTSGAPLNFNGQDLEEQLTQFENAFSLATIVEICEEVPQEVGDFMYSDLGFSDFIEELRLPGKYVYSYEDYKWLRQ